MSLPLLEPFTGTAAVLPNPPYSRAGPSAQTIGKDGSGRGISSGVDTSLDINALDTQNTYSPDQYSQLKIIGNLSVAGRYAQVSVRTSGADSTLNGYVFFTNGANGTGNTGLEKYVNGVSSAELCNYSPAAPFANGDVMRMEISGAGVIKVFKNGVILVPSTGGTSFTDATFSSGSAGFGVANVSTPLVLIDDWEGGNLVSASSNKSVTVSGRRKTKKKIKSVVVSGAPRATPVVTRVVRGRQIVVLKKKRRPDRKGKTTQIKRARLASQPAPKRPPKTQFVILKKKRRPERKAKTTLIKRARLAAQPAPKRPPKVQTLVLRKKVRPTRRARTTQINRTRLAISPPVVRPPKTATIVQRPKRRLRQGVTKILAALISTPPVIVKPAISLVDGRRRRKRTGSITILKGARRAVVATSIAPKKSTIVLSKKRRRRVGTFQVLAAREVYVLPPIAVPVKPQTVVLRKKRRKGIGDVLQIKAKAANTPPIRPPKVLTVASKRKHRKLQAKTTLLRAKRAGNQPIAPPRPPQIVAGRRRRRRTGDVLQITGAKRAPLPSVRPVKTLFQILPKKRRKKRTASTTRVTGARRAPPVAPRRKPLIVRRPKARKQISRKKTLILLKALFANPVGQFPAIITCFSGPSIQVVSKSGESIIVTALSNDQTKLRAIQ